MRCCLVLSHDEPEATPAHEPPPVRELWAVLTEQETEEHEHEKRMREEFPEHPWLDATPNALRRNVMELQDASHPPAPQHEDLQGNKGCCIAGA